ncbi:hypothetical protein J6TS7_34060 [Paenibacillus dendritiformis]|nr:MULTISPECIES: hypothetical protein [Paenibacillus]GIO79796.1 hypothetical protein J6TS7_34060 [Paenibacillus dendritiformis]
MDDKDKKKKSKKKKIVWTIVIVFLIYATFNLISFIARTDSPTP